MKKIIYLAGFLPILLYSCNAKPEAMFSVDTDGAIDVGTEVTFKNESDNAKTYDWDFGDGYGSQEMNPVHTYTSTGTYDVTLTAYSKSGVESKAGITIKVQPPTLLVVEVLEYYQQYVVPNASVRLYPTNSDWVNEKNMVDEGTTDDQGIAVFSHLANDDYFVDVWETGHDNYQLASEDQGFIKISNVYPHRINWFVAWVDKATHTKGQGKGSATYEIRKIERKFTGTPESPYTDADWKALYAKSIKVK